MSDTLKRRYLITLICYIIFAAVIFFVNITYVNYAMFILAALLIVVSLLDKSSKSLLFFKMVLSILLLVVYYYR